jgi:aerobic carbon-monoxide dehydrogenase large subunit
MAVTERPKYIGASAPRKEDRKLLTGQARYVDDLSLTGMVWAYVVRSPYAHARITRVDVSKAREAEGVVGAFSGADLTDDWKTTLPCVWLPTPDTKQPMHRPLATDKVRYAGDGVAIVLAESRALAKDRRRHSPRTLRSSTTSWARTSATRGRSPAARTSRRPSRTPR